MDQIYRGSDQWYLDHMPPIENNPNHTVLFELPLPKDDSVPPPPHIGEKKWGSNHVRFPCAVHDYARWRIIQTALRRDIRSRRELEQAILNYNDQYAKEWKFKALHHLFEQVSSNFRFLLFF